MHGSVNSDMIIPALWRGQTARGQRGAGGAAVAMAEDGGSTLAQAVFALYEQFSIDTFWPGFDPQGVPIALFDGEQTWLRGYPGIPAGFARHRAGQLLVCAGRHPALLANSLAELDSVLAATVMIDAANPGTPAAIAALALHEAFHVFQRHALPQWAANEAALFMYPLDNAPLVAEGLIEEWALEQALRTADPAEWVALALRERTGRHAAMPDEAVEWERQTELAEGIAYAVELQALGQLPAAGAAAAALPDVRRRCYRTGAMMALLLDRMAPSWRGRIAAGGVVFLDNLLGAVRDVTSASSAAVLPERRAWAGGAARLAVAAEAEARRERRAAFMRRPGQRLDLLAAPGDPLRLRGFDPMNVAVIGPGTLLHGRYLHLENSSMSFEMLGGEAITQAAGEHPLFNGMLTVTLTSLPELPSAAVATGDLALDLPWLCLRVAGGRFETTSAGTIVRLGASAKEFGTT
jgi:hypothetical protein